MTTAHRPTIVPAKGGEEQGGSRLFVPSRMFSAKDQLGQTQLKFRQPGQAAAVDLQQKDFFGELEAGERKHFAEKSGVDFSEEKQQDLRLLEAADGGGGQSKAIKNLVPLKIDEDDRDDDSASESSSDDEDEEAELLAELERIKKERAEEAAARAQEQAAADEVEKREELMRENPLVRALQPASFGVTRRWDDDVVFKNQARGEPKARKRFINDTIRSDFHRRFLNRYIK